MVDNCREKKTGMAKNKRYGHTNIIIKLRIKVSYCS